MSDSRRQNGWQAEAVFFDNFYRTAAGDLDIKPRMFRMYSEPRNLWNIRERANLFLGNVHGKKLLDYGCGIGEEAVYFAKLGASVTAIDISPVAVEITRKRAIHNNLAGRIQVFVMDCTTTGFRDRSFELIHGLGILHHVGVEAGLREAKRLLVPGGRAVFLEHMGNCDFVENKLKRWLQIRQRYYSEQEAPVKWRDCAAFAGEFKTFRMYPYTLFARLRRIIPALRTRFTRKTDYYILRAFPPLRYFASGLLICLET